MRRIQQLSPLVVSQIAAGEVIERPASVVKELLENSVDAGARRIDVEVGQGGAEFIRVVDDGCGIVPDDLALAFASHATSKLRDADDLFRVGTLGFRGEGLSSVGSVAQVTLQSRPAELTCGSEVRCHGGQLSLVRPWNGAPGTRVEVRHLFFNTPVRRKFQRSAATETGQICEAFTRLALSQLSLHLTLRHNGKPVYEVPASAGLLDRIALFFGREVRDRLYEVQAEQGGLTLAGYVADPACDRPGAAGQYLFVNGRWVRDRGLSQALQEGYRGLLMTGRHAVALLFLEVPPEDVDVNVHPTKAEVRFRDAEGLRRLIQETVRARLRRENLTPVLQGPATNAPPPPEPTLRFDSAPAPRNVAPPSSQTAELPTHTKVSVLALPPEGPTSRPVRAVQMHNLYLVVEVPEGVLMIDQHALHERILFGQMQERLRSGPLESQRLLIPEPVELPAAQAALVLEQRAALAELGLEVADFGGNTLLVQSYPAVFGKRGPRAVLNVVVEYLVTREQPPGREVLLNDLLALMACHGAVRAGDALSAEEVADLVAQRGAAESSHHCPHGRPTSLLFTRHDLDRQFKRA
ncbi:MAG TPA: DNA mismatch repair endonuclease MutL [Gemmataceae bacterium]|jgi:DNA mismatch repair protein MutL|nr:DNA mismatch repair endonuclease MutL [Gemmataceae bacterium]